VISADFVIALPIGTIIGWIISQVINDKLSRDRAIKIFEVTEFKKAAGDLRAAFAPAMVKFKLLSEVNAIKQMLEEELILQGVAIERFRPFVSPDKQSAYQEEWENYHQSHKRQGVSSVYFLAYAMGEEKERFKLFNERINAILKFTEK